MKFKELVKNIWGFAVAWLISGVLIYVSICYQNWPLSIAAYIFLLCISLLIFWYLLGFQYLLIPFVPILPILIIFSHWTLFDREKFLRKEKISQNVPRNTVVLFTHFDWFNIDYYINQTTTINDVKTIVKYLVKTKKEFSFYLKPTREIIEEVMLNKKVRQVYFVGHGSSDKFQIDASESLKYKEFNNKRYFKDFVHQIHCGTKYGKPLRKYVVSKDNWKKCFFVRKLITEKEIVAYFRNIEAKI